MLVKEIAKIEVTCGRIEIMLIIDVTKIELTGGYIGFMLVKEIAKIAHSLNSTPPPPPPPPPQKKKKKKKSCRFCYIKRTCNYKIQYMQPLSVNSYILLG